MSMDEGSMSMDEDNIEYHLSASHNWIPEEILSTLPEFSSLPFEIDAEAEFESGIEVDTEADLESGIENNEDYESFEDKTEGEDPIKCDLCSKQFPSKGKLMLHAITHSKSYKCDVCNRNLKNEKNLLRHLQLHIEDFKCTLCDKSFTSSARLSNHQKVHPKPWKCEICHASFTYKGVLLHHKKSHVVKPYRCETCGKQFTHNHHLKRHSMSHTGLKPFKCHVCGKTFADSSDLKRHTKIHPGQKPFKCDMCDECFADSGELKHHRKTHTTKCDICDKQFVHHFQLKRHLLIHTGEKPFKCEICDMQFSRNYHLKRHLRTHTGEKPFKCVVCYKQFTRDWHLKRHSRIHATVKTPKCVEKTPTKSDNSIVKEGKGKSKIQRDFKEKKYQCEVCHKSFTSEGRLKRHKKTHACETPQKSDNFIRQFSDSGSLTEHMILRADGESRQWNASEKLVTLYCGLETPFKPRPLSDEITYVSNIDEDIGSDEYLLSSGNVSDDRLSLIPLFSSVTCENDVRIELKFQDGNEDEILD